MTCLFARISRRKQIIIFESRREVSGRITSARYFSPPPPPRRVDLPYCTISVYGFFLIIMRAAHGVTKAKKNFARFAVGFFFVHTVCEENGKSSISEIVVFNCKCDRFDFRVQKAIKQMFKTS